MKSNSDNIVTGLEAPFADDASKSFWLKTGTLMAVSQSAQLENPDCAVSLQHIERGRLLSEFAVSLQGIATGDYSRYGRFFWELPLPLHDWVFLQSTVSVTGLYSGKENVIFWEEGNGDLAQSKGARIQGQRAWTSDGIAVTQTRSLPCTLHSRTRFDNNTAVILPRNPQDALPIWLFCSSARFNSEVRKIDQKIGVTNSKLLKVPFDLDHWQAVADERYPDGLPEPWSNDPTQWLFEGHPAGSTDPLHVAVARLLGYRWPENGDDDLDSLADADGIVCLPPVAGEQPAHEQLRALLARAYASPSTLPDFERYRVNDYVPSTPAPHDQGWSAQIEQRLLAHADAEGRDLAYWLHQRFFVQHCRLFKNRPFLWHIWDGRNDGFAAIVNYHKLDTATLDKLIYTYLGAWILDQRAQVAAGQAGADARLAAAETLDAKLKAIRAGEPPFDIYVRWKPLHEQPLGWDPDLNDGVRLNTRPFVQAGVLRRKFSVNWKKDRGRNPDGSERFNDRHFSLAEKQAARAGR